MSETVALTKNRQGKFTKQVKNIRNKVNRGIIKIHDGIKPRIRGRHRGLIYIGHIPHGFYENEMKEYFQQFGNVTNIKVCRSKKTGKSKGYGFVQFQHPEVAEVAAETMDNYLMFTRRLICKYIPPEKQHKRLFANTAWSTENYPLKIARKLHIKKRNNNPSEDQFNASTKKTLRKIRKKMDKLSQLGVNHVFQPANVPDDMLHLLQQNRNDNEGNFNIKSGNEVKLSGLADKQKKLTGITKQKLKDVSDICKDLKTQSLKTIKKKKDQLKKKNMLPQISFMQSDRLRRLAAVEVVKGNLVKNVNKLNSRS